ncbi:MAG: acyltransferase [Ignavibacteriales bacterium]|nr:acyltransferase [Ignavibacteriales bacterium]
MRVAIVQTNPIFGDVKANVDRALATMQHVEADLFVLPELFNTGYNFISTEEVGNLAETPDGYTFKRLAEFATKKTCYVVYGFAEKAEKIFNSAALVGPAGPIGVYRKVHLFNRENLFFAHGKSGFPVFDLPFGKIGIMICFDWIYPESARTLALKGAQLIVHPSNLVLPYCPDAMVTRCLENRVFAATANRVGIEDRGGFNLSFIGTSEIVSPRGEILKRLSADKSEVGVVDIDLSFALNKKINTFNDLLSGRRADQYSSTDS